MIFLRSSFDIYICRLVYIQKILKVIRDSGYFSAASLHKQSTVTHASNPKIRVLKRRKYHNFSLLYIRLSRYLHTHTTFEIQTNENFSLLLPIYIPIQSYSAATVTYMSIDTFHTRVIPPTIRIRSRTRSRTHIHTVQ